MGLTTQQILASIENGTTSLGIEFGSTRIKAVLTAEDNSPIASGSHDWENRLENGIWTYSLWRISGTDCRTVIRRWQRM